MGRTSKFKNPMNLAMNSIKKDKTPTDRQKLGLSGMTKGKTIKSCPKTPDEHKPGSSSPDQKA